MSSSTPRPKFTVSEFLAKAKVDKEIAELQAALLARAEAQGRPPGQMPCFSDMIVVENGQEYQYVDYVQEGGGVLGVALVGYTYALEKLGIRFLKLAGTSAGAINTLMMAAVEPANYQHDLKGKPVTYQLQSEAILHEMLDYDLWKLVDSQTSWWRRFVNNMVDKEEKFKEKMFKCAFRFTIFLAVISVAALTFSLFNICPIWLRYTACTISVVGLIMWLTTGFFYFSFKKKSADFVQAGFGINKGKAFHEWMKKILKTNRAETADELHQRMRARIQLVRLRPERFDILGMGYNSKVEGSLMKIISCDITNENKVEFPDFSRFYYDDPGKVSPADFVRASMSIPLFFQPFTLRVKTPETRFSHLSKEELTTRREFEKFKSVIKNVKADGQEVRFVDGGILSNFPINVFHNSKIVIARMPTFGAKLEDEDHEVPHAPVSGFSLGKYLGSIFSTLRFYYDRDFLKKNSVYQMGLAHIDVAGFNWLNFSMGIDEQVDLFRRGVHAATTFFLGGTFYRDGQPFVWKGYDWEEYKQTRKARMII